MKNDLPHAGLPAEAVGGTSPRVLIIDDSPEDREIYRLALLPEYQVIEAADAATGLAAWLSHRPDCVLLDHRPPDGDGLDVAAAAREVLGDPLPVVVLTGVADAALAVRALRAGVHDFVVKSSGLGAELRQAVRNSVRRSQLEREVAAQRSQLAANNDELARALAALRTSEARLKLGVQVARLALADVDCVQDSVTLSPEAAALFGVPAERAGQPIACGELLALVHPDDRPAVLAAVARSRDPAGDGSASVEYRHLIPGPQDSRRTRWLSVQFQTSFDDARTRAMSAMLVARDISEDKESQARLRRGEERLRLAHAAAGLSDWTWTVGEDAAEWSPGMYEIHGLSPALPATWDSLAAVVLPEDLSRVRQRIEHALASDGHYTVDYRVVHPQRGLRWIMGIGRVIERGADGRPQRLTGVLLDITDRKRIEDRLTDSEARFSALAQAAPLILYTADAHGRCDYVNERFWQVTGLAPADGLPRHAHLHPDDLPLLREGWRASRAAGGLHEQRFRLRVGGPGSEDWRWYRTRALPVRDDEGRIQHWVGMAYDVHEELLREARLQWLVELGDTLGAARSPRAVVAAISSAVGQQFQVARCGLTHIDFEAGVAVVHDDWHRPRWRSLAGEHRLDVYSDEVLNRLSHGEMVVLRDTASAPETAALYQSSYASLGLRSIVALPLQRDGRAVYLLWLTDDRPRDWSQAELLLIEAVAQRGWLALENARLFDATREALVERDQALQETLHNERFLRQIADTVPEALYLFDLKEQRNVYCNRKVGELIGYSADEIQSMGSEFMPAVMHPDDRPHALAHLAELDAAPEGTVRTIEYRMRRRDGRWRWFSSSETVWSRDEAGNARVVLGAAQDVTDRRAAVDALHEAARRKDEFLAMLGHELRNPLAPIRNAVEVLQRGADADTVVRLSGTISRQVQHLSRLVDDLLDVSRITQGKIVLRPSRIELAGAAQSAIESVRQLFDSRGQTLVVNASAAPLWVDADATRLAQVIGNLLHNAAKYTPEGGRIDIDWFADEDMAVVRVRDDGIGIAPELLPRVFDLFVQEHRDLDRSQGGLGIGLALVRTLVGMMGGRVHAYSAGSGHGSTFSLSLPLAAAPQAAHSTSAAPRNESNAGRRVLVVDDNVDAAETLALVLRLQGHDARVETSSEAALNTAAHFAPEVVFLDIGLPDMDGYAVARAMRAHSATQAATLVALTGYGTERDRARAVAEGFDAHLTKPADLSKIVELLSGRASGL